MIINKLGLFDKYFNILEKAYVYLFLLYAALGSINLTHGSAIIPPVMWISFSLGFVIFFYRLINYKKYYKMPGMAALLLLLFSICLSTILNFKYSFKENTILCIYWALFFFVIYARSADKTSDEIKKELEIFFAVFVCYVTIAVVISFIMLGTGFSKRFINATGFEVYIGFVIGRLWGVFLNTNQGAISAGIASVMLVYFFLKVKKKWVKALCIIDVFAMFMFIALSDSRSGAVANGVIFATFYLCLLIYKIRDKKIWIKAGTVLLAVVIGFAGFMVPRQLKIIYNEGVKIANSIVQQVQQNESCPDNSEPLHVYVDRGYDLSGDISNRRFDVWGGGIQLFLDSPKTIIYGLSFRGFTEYAKQNQPYNYLVNKTKNKEADMTTLDNEFFNILVANGIIGVAAAVVLIVSILSLILKNYLRVGKKYQTLIAIGLASVFGLASASMFASMIFYNFSPNMVAFWFILGGTAALLRNTKEGK